MSIAYIALLAVLSFMVLGLLLTVYLMSDFSFKVEMWIEDAYRRITRK
jgi:hypothetical protein